MSSDLDLVRSFITEHQPRPHVSAFVRPHHICTEEERLRTARAVGWNVFKFPSEMLMGGDLLSDSGTTAPTVEQLAASLLGDEAYGTNWGYGQLLEVVEQIFGISMNGWEFYLFPQCRVAEHALYSQTRGRGNIIPSNGFFDTTRANAEANGFTAIDIPDERNLSFNFKGNIDILQLQATLEKYAGQIPFVLVTVTNNTNGGQPVSMNNIRMAALLAHNYGAPLFLDACRFAENAWFIKNHESEYRDRTIPQIVAEMVSYCDGFTISFKKDGLANIGGALLLRKDSQFTQDNPGILEVIRDHQIMTVGHSTYGALSGSAIMMIVEGLKYVVTQQYLAGRVGQVQSFGSYLSSLGVPILTPIGGHAVYIDVDRFFEGTEMRREDFGGISLSALLLLKGVRLCELGAFAFGKYDPATGEETFPPHNFVRAAVPRQKYEDSDLKYVAECIAGLHKIRDRLPIARLVRGRNKTLRHMKAQFELVYRT